MEEVAASLPPECARKMRESTPESVAQDWIAVGTIYNWIKSDRTLSSQFIAEVGNRPAEAALALAKAVARSLNPPPPDPRVRQLDRYGLILETGLAAVILLTRGLLLSCILVYVLHIAPSVGVTITIRQIVLPGIEYLNWSAVADWRIALASIVVTCWLAAECFWVPACLEYVRSLPLRWTRARPYACWRTDALHAVWLAHASSIQCLIQYRVANAAFAIGDSRSANSMAGMWLVLCSLVFVFAVLVGFLAWKRLLIRDQCLQNS
jgi:hypothetical protein